MMKSFEYSVNNKKDLFHCDSSHCQDIHMTFGAIRNAKNTAAELVWFKWWQPAEDVRNLSI